MVEIIPGILEKEANNLRYRLLKASILTNRAHIDVIDENFAPNKTLYPKEWPEIPLGLEIGAHLMVNNPLSWINECLRFGAQNVIGQIEAIDDQVEFVKVVAANGGKAGLALDLSTPVSRLNPETFSLLSFAVLMSVRAGYSGQVFNAEVLPKIKALREIVGNNAEIIVDGGITPDTARVCLEWGVQSLVVNSYLWENPENNFHKLQALA